MADARHTFEALASHLIRSSLPLVRAAASLDGFRSFAARLGFQPTSIPAPFASLSVNASGANLNFDRLRFVAERAEVGEAREALFAVTIPEERGSFRRFAHRRST